MLSAERRTKILELIRTEGNVEVKNLATRLAVSLMTVRRDLETLEEKGLLVRTHGGAVLPGPENTEVPYHTKRLSHAEEKRRIARKALELICDGDTLILDSGSTTLEIARLSRWKKGLTVITTDLKIALELGNQPGIKVFCTGGLVQTGVYTLLGSQAIQFLRGFNAQKAFLGASAVDLKAGITTPTPEKAPVKKAIVEAAREVVLVADHTKFGKVAFAQICPVERIKTVITDRELDPEMAQRLKGRGVALYQV